MKVILHGCNGKMGQVMTKIISSRPNMEIVCGVDKNPEQRHSYPVYRSLVGIKEAPDVLIDFSHHSCLDSLLAYGLANNVPLVICTTGFEDGEIENMTKASKLVPILHSANMSLGINLLLTLAAQAASALYGNFDIEIVEKHHNQKLDSPSGTALLIADAIKKQLSMDTGTNNPVEYTYGRHSKTDKRHLAELGIHSVRGGAVVGEHDVMFLGQGEVLEIKHSALSRDVFAYGAVSAASFIATQKPGLYSMSDVVSSHRH